MSDLEDETAAVEALRKGFGLGDWYVQPALNRISDAKRQVTVEPQAMEVLCLLASRPGEVVATDEIVRIVWAGRPISDNPVYKTINKLRRALGDPPRNPTYLATVTKRGYRLIAPVTVDARQTPASAEVGVRGTASAVTQPLHPDTQPNTQLNEPVTKRKWVRYTVGGFLVLQAAVLFGVLLHVSGARNDQVRVTQVIAMPGSSSDAAIAADGSIVFVNDSTGVPELWRLAAGASEPQQLTFAANPVSDPNWSPDGQWVVFSRSGDIWRLSPGALGATLGPAAGETAGESSIESSGGFFSGSSAGEERLIRNGSYASYSPDGQHLVFERGTQVWLADANGLEQTRFSAIAEREQFFAPRRPVFSPDGRHFAYFESNEGPTGDIWTVDLASGKRTRLTFDRARAGHPVFSSDGQWINFHSKRNGTLTLWRVPSNGGPVEPMMASAGDDSLPFVAPDGTSLIYTSNRTEWSLVISDPATLRTAIQYDSRFEVYAPEISPDGERVAFFATEQDRGANVYVQHLNTRAVTQLTLEPGSINVMPKWSSDGDWLYYYRVGSQFTWRRVSVEGGASQPVQDGWRFNSEHDVNLRPNGHEVIFAKLSGDEVLSTQLKNLDTGEERPFPYKISWPDWSRDGRELLATAFDVDPLPVGRIVLCGEPTAAAWVCTTIAERGQHPFWGNEPDEVYYVVPEGDDTLEVWLFNRSTSTHRRVMELSPVAVDLAPFVDVTPDGRIVWVRYQAGRAELWRVSW